MKKLFLVALAAVGLASCVQNEELAVAGSTTAIAFGDSFVYNATKADPTTTTATIDNFDVWAFMDEVGGTVLTDEDVTKNASGAWGYQNLQYWAPNHTYYFAALSPANSANVTETLATGEAAKLGLGEIAFTNVDGTEDLLYAKAKETTGTMAELAANGKQPVAMQFQHLLSKVKFTFQNGFATNNMKVVVKNVRMSAPKSATIDLAVADYSKGWVLGNENPLTLEFGNVDAAAKLASGASASTDNYRLTIPASSAYEYTVTFDVVVYSGSVEAFKEDNKQATIKGYELAMGKAYNFTAVINADSFGLQPIEFTAEVDPWDAEIPGNAEVVVGQLVRDAQSLVNAIANGGKNGVVTLGNDVALTQAIELPAGKKVTLDLGGNTIEGAFTKGGDGANAMVKNNGTLTIVGGTIKNSTENGDAAIYNTGNLVLEGVKIEGAPIGTSGYPEYAVYSVGGTLVVNDTEIVVDRGAIRLEAGADVTINGGKFAVTDAVGSRTLTGHVIYAEGSASKLTINGGEFAQNIPNGGGTSVICPAGATIKIYGGNFYHVPVADAQSKIFQNYMGYGAPVDVYGGTYNDDSVTKSGNLADGYKAVEANGKYSVVANDDVTAATSSELQAALAAGGEVILVDDVTYSASITNDAVVNLNGNSFLPASTISLNNNADLTMVGGNYVVNGTYGHVDVRPSTADGSVVVYENVNFAYNKLVNTYGPSTNRLGSVVEVCATTTDAHTKITFKNCTFDNAMVLFEGMSGKTGTFEAVFEGCTFNALTSSAPIYVQNYVKGTIKVVNCTFNLECTSSTASAISVSSSSSTSVVLTATNNTFNAVAATPYTYDASKGETEAHNVKVNGTPANIKFIFAYENTTVTETGTKKSGIAKL